MFNKDYDESGNKKEKHSLACMGGIVMLLVSALIFIIVAATGGFAGEIEKPAKQDVPVAADGLAAFDELLENEPDFSTFSTRDSVDKRYLSIQRMWNDKLNGGGSLEGPLTSPKWVNG